MPSNIKKIKRVLVANRGEIALRVVRACREAGIETVAVYSEVDSQLPNVLEADMAVGIGPAIPAESYLNIDRLVAAARETRCDAVHPGYGFLSENSVFAQRCRDAGLIFIGPSQKAIEAVGDKVTARRIMAEAGIPQTRGVEIHGEDWAAIEKDARGIGFPLMVKASAGGGGKGMRIVHEAAALRSAIEAGRREAKSAFGDDRVYMETYIENPRHIEFQVIADHHGNMVHLFERECSIQRRHQKIVEESPSLALTPELRREMGETACRVMAAVDYTNAGTVEFLLDQQGRYYFLEVNARIQVEHPVTEMVTGVDLVREQLRIAAGEKLSFTQEDLRQTGHAIECRIYAEDPENNFFPATGKLHLFRVPEGPGIRCDAGVSSGLSVSHYYDPILAKLIVHAGDRAAAIERMHQALSDFAILGIKSPIPFLKAVIAHPAFARGDLETGFIGRHFPDWRHQPEPENLALALLAASAKSPKRVAANPEKAAGIPSPWELLGDWQAL